MSGFPPEARYEALADLIDGIIRTPHRPTVLAIAEKAGYSRYHLPRLFRGITGEGLGDFIRRVRLERAAYLLQTENASLVEAAVEGGYSSPEAFGRAFNLAYGIPPAKFRRDASLSWVVRAVNDLHWNPDVANLTGPGAQFPSHFELRLPYWAAVWRRVGNYALLSEGWGEFEERFGRPPEGRTLLTIYRDTMWTHPISSEMRADLGWFLDDREPTPVGLTRIPIPGGLYRVTDRLVRRNERNDAWISMSSTWSSRQRAAGLLSFDEYPEWPLPFPSVETRIVVGVASAP